MRRFASVLLVDSRGWILLQERDDLPEIDPGCWGCPGGHLEDDETPEEAAYREFVEETGASLAPGTLVPWRAIDVRHEGRESDDRVYLFVAGTDLTDDDITCHEGRQIRFVDPSRVTTLPLTRAAGLALQPFLSSEQYLTLQTQEKP